ncbi:hypothetical protein DEO72_LG5g2865 [Vigna unguiculata]|uniref:Uncharacterized protein n=1 Tax=Vigna unguiculata TaxID=3917 RepID=A0A4D6M2F3_VIGUN|nr:hypothetical protein DEO72_LG5g2865 [Vigna unguiculata]
MWTSPSGPFGSSGLSDSFVLVGPSNLSGSSGQPSKTQPSNSPLFATESSARVWSLALGQASSSTFHSASLNCLRSCGAHLFMSKISLSSSFQVRTMVRTDNLAQVSLSRLGETMRGEEGSPKRDLVGSHCFHSSSSRLSEESPPKREKPPA